MLRRAQMEVLGLLIIVILFSMGLLFAIKFVILKPQTDVRGSFVQTELASNVVNTLLKTTSNCKGADFTELFADCAGFPRIDCEDDGSVYSYKVADSCYSLQQGVKQILGDTLDEWKVNYNLTSYVGDESSTLEWTKEIGFGVCGDLDDGDTEPFTIPTDAGMLTVMLKVCG